ncbi:zf-HC2 domain-containing protein [Streptomyces sp. ISL-1]|uniref:zf-HC2 domain-containing protein n=1 Tax=Streptomyces sp. ISL-1 TaxID=2817657 RepID=UPI0027E52F17|nr:zf-HC2 domain-containing protein [Streptomyces sp. ISL-1]
MLHALPDDELRAFETHLAACEACRDEVAELQATAARLGRAVALSPLGGMRDVVLGRVATTRQEFKLLSGDGARRRTGRLPRLMLAASIAVAAAFGGVAVWQHQEAADAARVVLDVPREQRRAGSHPGPVGGAHQRQDDQEVVREAARGRPSPGGGSLGRSGERPDPRQ